MSDESVQRIRALARDVHRKADDLQQLVEKAPIAIRYLRAYGDYYKFVADEYDRVQSGGTTNIQVPNAPLDAIDRSLNCDVPSAEQLAAVTGTVVSNSTSVTFPLLAVAHQSPHLHILQDPPASFLSLRASAETVQQLNALKPGLGDAWQRAWDSAEAGNVNSVKNAAANGRSVVDELSRLTPQEIVSALPWCEPDNNGRPTRASRYAWIMYGQKGPASKPSTDPAWKPLREAHNELSKYDHITSIVDADVNQIRSLLVAVQERLEQYLEKGYTRLRAHVDEMQQE